MIRENYLEEIKLLKDNLDTVGTVYEWAQLLDFDDINLFRIHMLKKHGELPSKIFNNVRLDFASKMLVETDLPCWEIAKKISLPDERSLYKFFKYHTGSSPTNIREGKNPD